MHYKGTSQPNIDIEFIPYEDKYYEQYAKCRQDCFYELRKENDIQPYVPFQLSEKHRENTLKRREYIYIALMDEQLIASFDLMDGYLDSIIVPPAYQGKGYGKQATQFAINKALSQNNQLIHLSVLEWNVKAVNLYKSLGFEIVQTAHIYRQFGDK
jgi:ribosomal protein S18 acetylase RimI-like enzyme